MGTLASGSTDATAPAHLISRAACRSRLRRTPCPGSTCTTAPTHLCFGQHGRYGSGARFFGEHTRLGCRDTIGETGILGQEENTKKAPARPATACLEVLALLAPEASSELAPDTGSSLAQALIRGQALAPVPAWHAVLPAPLARRRPSFAHLPDARFEAIRTQCGAAPGAVLTRSQPDLNGHGTIGT